MLCEHAEKNGTLTQTGEQQTQVLKTIYFSLFIEKHFDGISNVDDRHQHTQNDKPG